MKQKVKENSRREGKKGDAVGCLRGGDLLEKVFSRGVVGAR